MDDIKEKYILLNNKIDQLNKHQLLTTNKINNTVKLKVFMENHVYAVWDFMSILKSLQNHICPSNYPWKRTVYTTNGIARLINEIVLAEESDEIMEGKYMSHFDLYVQAMKDIHADTSKIESLIDIDISAKKNFKDIDIPDCAQDFLSTTFKILSKNKLHMTAALFTYGRETTLPDMFVNILRMTECIKNTDNLKLYLKRHIDIDSNRHGPLSLKLYNHTINNNPYKTREALDASLIAIDARYNFWSSILYKINEISD